MYHKQVPYPESFVRGGPTLTTFFSSFFDEGKGGSKCNYKRAIIGPPTKRHGWRADDGRTLIAGLVLDSDQYCEGTLYFSSPEPKAPR